MGNVTPLRGSITGEKKPNASVIEALERALEAARAGEVVEIGLVYLHHDGTANWNCVAAPWSFSMIGAAACLQGYLVGQEIFEEDP